MTRVEFPGQAAGKARPDPPEVCIETVRDATTSLARQLSVGADRVAIGGRSFGGRMCSLAAAAGLEVAGLVLVSYPLHPPKQPERLRTSHFPDLHVPCLFVSGRRDPFATPEELERATAAIPGEVTITWSTATIRCAERSVMPRPRSSRGRWVGSSRGEHEPLGSAHGRPRGRRDRVTASP